MVIRPENEEELQKREAIGVIRASRFVRKYARSHRSITINTICEIHREIFSDAWPDIAGVYRMENLKITDSQHKPPHYLKVMFEMQTMDLLFQEKLVQLRETEGSILSADSNLDEASDSIDRVIRVAAWIHHKITYIHPFREGNGRTARLAANLILERFGLVGISIKVEKENKNRYRNALAQIDQHGDYEPLVDLMYEGLIDRFDGVAMKYYDVGKK